MSLHNKHQAGTRRCTSVTAATAARHTTNTPTGQAGNTRRTLHRALTVLTAAIIVLVCAPVVAQADYEQVAHFATEGTELPKGTGMAVNTTGAGGVEPGSLYLSDGYFDNRVLRYSPAGELKEIWGLDTIASGPDLPDQLSTVTVSATSGTYELTAQTGQAQGEFTKGSTIVTEVRTEVGALHVGDVIEAPGGEVATVNASGNTTSGSTTVMAASNINEWVDGMAIYAPGIPAGTTVTAISAGALDSGTLTLSKPATETKIGDSLHGRTTIAAVSAGTLELSLPSTHTTYQGLETKIAATETTAPIAFNASAATFKAALVALPAFEATDLSVTGGPETEGTARYQVGFEGAYAGSPVGVSSTEVTLAGGSPSSAVEIETPVAAATPGFQRCRLDAGDRCTNESPSNAEGGNFKTEGFAFYYPVAVAVDQTTGYVYVLNKSSPRSYEERSHNLIEVFSADGSQVIARFGDAAVSEKTDEEPEKIHGQSGAQSIAVDESGDVYVGDGGTPLRVMCFRPESSGDYQQYVYCGQSQDLETGVEPTYLSFDDARHLYVASREFIEERSQDDSSAAPLCTDVTKGRVEGMSANPKTGEVFYFNGSPNAKKLYRLKPCDPAVGKFEQAQAPAAVSPPTTEVSALAFNPSLSWASGRPRGVVYVVDREQHEIEGINENGLGYVFAPAEVHAPTVIAESASSIRTASAVLHAEIDPNGFDTRYVFQYLTDAAYETNGSSERFAGAREAPAGGGELGSGAVGQVDTTIAGLSPDTAYRFRVVASSDCNEEGGEPCVTRGEAFTFATYPLVAPGLPDHRAYELVSPAQKHGGEVLPAQPQHGSCGYECKPKGLIAPIQSSPDGEALSYGGLPFTPLEGADEYDAYVARRTAAGWQTTALIPSLPRGIRPLAFDQTLTTDLRAPEALNALELQSTSDPGSATALATGTRSYRAPSEFKLSYGGATADFSRVFFAANDALTTGSSFAPVPPDPGASGQDLYESSDGALSLVNVLPGNATVATGAAFASVSPDTHVVSADGRRVYWTAGGEIYVREDGELTREIRHAGTFLTASADGLQVLLSDGCLYSLSTEACTDLTEGRQGFQGIAGTGEEGGKLSHIYFVDTAVLPGAKLNERGQPAQSGQDNLYSWSEGGLEFIATLSVSDDEPSGLVHDWATVPEERTAEASRNGRFLAFASLASLTGYNNVGSCGIGAFDPELGTTLVTPAPCAEAYLYDSAGGRLVCASCDPTGEAPLGPTALRRTDYEHPWAPQPRYLTDEGRLYFDSVDSLSARDDNEGVEDVYEFEPQGAGKDGTCQRTAGCVFLISSGTSTVDSNLIAVDETGANVFFDTRDQLTLDDKDELLDIYDAREGGGLSSESEVARAECQGESCQPPVSAPSHQTPNSLSFMGAGNVLAPPPPVELETTRKSLTRAQKLARALKSCRRDRPKSKRVACEKRTRKRFGLEPKTVRKGGK
jgi:hypothetical protein